MSVVHTMVIKPVPLVCVCMSHVTSVHVDRACWVGARDVLITIMFDYHVDHCVDHDVDHHHVDRYVDHHHVDHHHVDQPLHNPITTPS